jgi:hypothetical protein
VYNFRGARTGCTPLSSTRKLKYKSIEINAVMCTDFAELRSVTIRSNLSVFSHENTFSDWAEEGRSYK